MDVESSSFVSTDAATADAQAESQPASAGRETSAAPGREKATKTDLRGLLGDEAAGISAETWLAVFVLDYLRKNGHAKAADCFRASIAPSDALLSFNPNTLNHFNTPPIDIRPAGFLAEWWSVFWDIYNARSLRSSSKEAAHFVDHESKVAQLQHLTQQQHLHAQIQSAQQQQQMRVAHNQQPQPQQQQPPSSTTTAASASVTANSSQTHALKSTASTPPAFSSSQLSPILPSSSASNTNPHLAATNPTPAAVNVIHPTTSTAALSWQQLQQQQLKQRNLQNLNAVMTSVLVNKGGLPLAQVNAMAMEEKYRLFLILNRQQQQQLQQFPPGSAQPLPGAQQQQQPAQQPLQNSHAVTMSHEMLQQELEAKDDTSSRKRRKSNVVADNAMNNSLNVPPLLSSPLTMEDIHRSLGRFQQNLDPHSQVAGSQVFPPSTSSGAPITHSTSQQSVGMLDQLDSARAAEIHRERQLALLRYQQYLANQQMMQLQSQTTANPLHPSQPPPSSASALPHVAASTLPHGQVDVDALEQRRQLFFQQQQQQQLQNFHRQQHIYALQHLGHQPPPSQAGFGTEPDASVSSNSLNPSVFATEASNETTSTATGNAANGNGPNAEPTQKSKRSRRQTVPKPSPSPVGSPNSKQKKGQHAKPTSDTAQNPPPTSSSSSTSTSLMQPTLPPLPPNITTTVNQTNQATSLPTVSDLSHPLDSSSSSLMNDSSFGFMPLDSMQMSDLSLSMLSHGSRMTHMGMGGVNSHSGGSNSMVGAIENGLGGNELGDDDMADWLCMDAVGEGE